MKTSFDFFFKRHLQDVFKTSWWRRTYSYQSYVSKTSWSRPIYWSCPFVFKTSSRRFQDIFKTSCHNVFKTFSRRLQDVFKTSSRRLAKTSSRRLANTSGRHLQDVLKTYYQVKLFLLTSLWEVFNLFVRRTAKTVLYRRIDLGHTSEKFTVSAQNLQKW